jgi:diguanylate cyclase (GGDEF)-like protein
MLHHGRTGRLARRLFAVIGAWLVAYELNVVLFDGPGSSLLASRFTHDVELLVASGLCLWAAVRNRGERLAWLLLGAGALAWTLGEIYYTAVLWEDSSPPVPSPADAGYLSFSVLTLAGLVLLARPRWRGAPRGLWADGAIAALAVAGACAAIVFETVLESVSGAPLSVALNLAYALVDLVLIGVIVGTVAGTGWRWDRRWALLALGILIFWVADSYYLVQTAQGTYASGGWFDAGWWAGLTLIAAAAWQPAGAEAPQGEAEGMRFVAVPLAFGAVGIGVLVYGCLSHINAVAIALGAASLIAVMARLILTFRDNVAVLRSSRDEALTDMLTGLGNRRALAQCLEAELVHACEDTPLVLVLLDLDGFKHYNDTFGHPAGDALLVRLGANLSRFLAGRGHAFRMGGDEFCALFRAGSDLAPALVAGSAAALSEHGEGFTVTSSYGAIVLPRETADAIEALRIADQRMYARKNAGRMSAGRQSRDVLLRALAERNPDLGAHLDGVAELAEATAIRLGLSGDEVGQIRQAAELHDVGKVAIPDAILAKPGALEEHEWQFVCRHTLIGERIIAAAPALEPVAALVRSSHEHWDGSGYPDALAEEAIPLGSRIVAVADAFDAMTSNRAYRPACSPSQALEELVRCAGTQFDPLVVSAFRAAWAERRAGAVAVAA